MALHGCEGLESDSNETWQSDSTVQDSLKPHCEEDPQLLTLLGMADQVPIVFLWFLNSARTLSGQHARMSTSN